MLKSLTVENFVLIDQCELNFHDGFSAFTGETGAGKSLLIDAIGLLTGDRSSSTLIQNGKDRALISGIFDMSKDTSKLDMFDEFHINDASNVNIVREIYLDGKNTIKVNGQTITIQKLKQFTNNLIDIHSQHDTQYLLNKSNHLNLLDEVVENKELINEVKQLYRHYDSLTKEFENALSTNYNEREIEFIQFEIDEIKNANLVEGEEESLEQQLKEIQNFEKVYSSCEQAVNYFEEDEGVSAKLFKAINLLNGLNEIDTYQELNNEIKEKYYDLVDLFERLKDSVSSLEGSVEELDFIQNRLFEISKLKRKYGGSVSAVLKRLNESLQVIESYSNKEEYIAKMQKEIDIAYDKYIEKAEELSELRKNAAKSLETSIIEQCQDLMLTHAQFIIDFVRFDGNEKGIDDVEFLISLNPQEICRPLKQVASGGELSRLMLGLKTIFTSLQGISCVIFDEIDSGVSGKVATAIGLKMALLAKHAQCFSVTHLSQVAACAQTHYHVKKDIKDNKAIASIKELSEEERINEIALISNASLSDMSLQAAKELYLTNQALMKGI